jgi:hypothetical protein
MVYLLSHSPPLILPRIFHRHLGIDRKGTAIPAPKPFSLILNQFITNIKAKTGGTKEGANTTTYALSGYSLPVVLIVKGG